MTGHDAAGGADDVAAPTLTVLVVDDSPMNLELVTELLETAGYTVRHASTAEAGLRIAGDEPIDLILMDIGLPGMDGHSGVRALKADPQTRGIPTVALTAYAMAGDEERARQSGFDGYITKPIETRRFPGLIAQILERGRTPL